MKWIMAALALASVVTLIVLTLLLFKRYHPAYYGAFAFLALIALLTITDEFGLPDLFMLVITLGALALLIKDRRWYLGMNH